MSKIQIFRKKLFTDSMSLEKRLQNTVLLGDGRKLTYADLGDPKGKPVFHFHGFPSSRLEAKIIHTKAEEVGLRLISIDRPGFGLSDFQPKRRIIDWPKDIEELANELKINKFNIFAISTGACYALACASCLAERINKIVIISALGSIEFKENGLIPNHRFIFTLAKFVPFIFKIGFWFIRCRRLKKEDKGDRYLKLNYRNLSLKDRLVLKDSNILNIIAEAQYEAFRFGLKGIAHEAKLLGGSWGFDIDKISKQLDIYLFHGLEDKIAQAAATKEIEQLLQRCKAKYFQDEGHISLLANFEEEIFSTVTFSSS